MEVDLKYAKIAGKVDLSELAEMNDIPTLRQVMQSEISSKMNVAYQNLLQENSLNPNDYYPVVTCDQRFDDFAQNKITVTISAVQKTKLGPND